MLLGFLETVRSARSHLKEQDRVSLRALKREFELDDDALDELVEELVDVQRVAAREGRILVWVGPAHSEAANTAPASVEHEPRDYTPKHLADKILRSKSALEGERKQVTVLFADVKDSTELSRQVDPEDWHRMLDRFFQILTEGVHRFEGTVNQYTGDGIMALFGAPIAHEDHAQRACYAALYLREQLETHARELKREQGLIFSVRMGLNSGEVVVGKIGDDLRMDYTAQGHTVALAQRMEQLAGPEKIYVAEATQRFAEGYVDLEDLGEFQIQGAAEPLRVFELRGRGSERTRFDISLARGLTRFIGRGTELRMLDEALERSLAGEAQIVALVAEAGVGKSRLCYEFGERCRGRGIPVRVGRGVAHGSSVPFLPIMEYLRDTVDIREGDSDQRARQKIAGSVVLLEDALTEALPLLFDFMGVPDPDRPPPTLEADVRQRQLFEIQRRLHRARSERNPVVLLFEDLHWFDPGSLQHLEHLVQAIQGTRTLLVANFRPEFQAPWMGKSFYQQSALRPLSVDEITELLREHLGSDDSLADLYPLVLKRSGGNPFYAEEVVRSLAESGSLEGERGDYRLVAPLSKLAIPSSVRDLVAARIDRLPELNKRLLQTGAVIGSEFSESLIREAGGVSGAELTEGLGRLIESELIYEEALYPEPVYAFRHPLLREVAYTSQLEARRADLHRAVAQTLERTSAERLDDTAALLAHHWEQAGEALTAAGWAARAAERLALSAPQSALEQWHKVRILVEHLEDEPGAAELDLAACEGLLFAGRYFGSERREATRLFEAGVRRAHGAGDATARARLTAAYGMLHATWGDAEGWHSRSEEAAGLIEDAEDPESRLEVIGSFAFSLLIMESAQRSLDVIERELERSGDAASFAVGSAAHSAYVHLLRLQGFALSYLGRLGEAFAVLERGLELALEASYTGHVSNLHQALATTASVSGDASATVQYARRSLEAANRIDSPALRMGAHLYIGRGHLVAEEFDLAIEELELAHKMAHEHGTALLRDNLVLAGLAEAHLGLGQLDRARELGALVSERARGGMTPRARLLQAQIQLSTRDVGVAADVQRALDLAADGFKQADWRVFAPDVLLTRAKLAALQDQGAERELLLREAHRLYTEMGATGYADRVAREFS